MRVILTSDVKSQGKKNDIIEVKDGYGQNFLIRQGLAVIATKGNLTKVNSKQKKEKIATETNIAELQILANQLEKLEITIKVKTGKEDKMFGSVTTSMIANHVKEYKLDKKQISIPEPISALGTYTVIINLHKQVAVKLKINIIKR